MLGNGKKRSHLLMSMAEESPLCDSRTQQPAVETLPQPVQLGRVGIIKDGRQV